MEMGSGKAKPGRSDCPACGERIKSLVRKGTFFRPTTNCPHCGARLSSDLSSLIYSFWFAVFIGGILPMEDKHKPTWVNTFFLVAAVAVLLFDVCILVRIISNGAYYRVIPDGTHHESSVF
jgi:hypothetical protein